jgi:Bardet-Biedl syndrome 4 protein
MTTLGLVYLRIGENMEAFKFLGQALSIDQEDSKSILAVCSIMQDRSEYDAALLRYRIMAKNNPNSPHLWNNIGMCFFG